MKKALPVVATVLALGALAATLQAQNGSIIQKIVVKVNGEIYTQTELEQEQVAALRGMNAQITSADQLQNAQIAAQLRQVTPVLLVDAVEELLLTQKARDLGVKATDEDFNGWLDTVKADNNFTDEQFVEALAQENLSIAQLRQDFERNYMIQGVQQIEIRPRMNLTEEEIRQYYAAHPDEFMQPESVMLREIFMEVAVITRDGQQVVNAAAEEETLQRMNAARARAVAGEDFATVASELSESPSKANGGLIGPINTAEIAEAMQQIISPLGVGDISQPVRTSRGYQMLRLEARTEAAPEPFLAVRDRIGQKIQTERIDAEMERYIRSLLSQAQIEWKDEDYRLMYEQQIAVRDAAIRSGSGGARK